MDCWMNGLMVSTSLDPIIQLVQPSIYPMNDLRFACRQLLKNPGFTTVAVLTLALCIGANLAICAVVDAILVRSLPLPGADRLVIVHNAYPGAGIKRGNASIANYFE